MMIRIKLNVNARRTYLFVLSILLWSAPKLMSQDFIVDDFVYKVIPDAAAPEVTVEGCISPVSDIVIPEKVIFEGIEYTVTEISEQAFSGGWLLDSSLTSVTMPNSIRCIGNNAFAWCYSLKTVNFGSGLEFIGWSAFFQCQKLEEAILPDGVKTIEDGAFYSCYALKKAYLGNSLTEIAPSLMCYCRSLITVNVPETVTKIGMEAFLECKSMGKIVIPESVEEIDNYAFYSCTALHIVNIPEATVRIGLSAFEGCSSLENIYLPNVKEWGYSAFVNSGLRDIEFGEGITTIGVNCFSNCEKLYEVHIGENVETICSGAFNKCRNLSLLYFNDKVTTIEDFAFARCRLYTLKLPDSVKEIGNYAFQVNSNLSSVQIGSGLETCGKYLFKECKSIERLKVSAENPPVCDTDALDDIDKSKCQLYVPASAIEKYQVAEQWKDFTHFNVFNAVDEIVLDGGAEEIDIYNLKGQRVGNSFIGLPHGLYIVRSGEKSLKIKL